MISLRLIYISQQGDRLSDFLNLLMACLWQILRFSYTLKSLVELSVLSEKKNH